MIIPTCTRCQSTNVLKDAYAEWDAAAQTWVLRTVFDDTLCDDCGSTNIEDQPYVP